jgi:hypothetical protein
MIFESKEYQDNLMTGKQEHLQATDYNGCENHCDIIEKIRSVINRISPELKVLNGPFKGLIYPTLEISEWTLVPKIVGSYEMQLHSIIHRIMGTSYSDILNIGCAEGYYAVGLAVKMPQTIVHCFDSNEKDLDFCRVMANCNRAGNLKYNGICTAETLRSFDFKNKSLIICDCEGCEIELFTPEVIEKLRNVDLLIEMHDLYNPVISAELITRFQYTHQIQIYNNHGLDTSHFDGLDELQEDERLFSFLEHRGGFNKNIFMEWAFFTYREHK